MANLESQHRAVTARTWRALACALVILLSAWIQTRVMTRTLVDNPVRADAVHYVSYAWNLQKFHVFSRSPTWRTDDSQTPDPDKLTLPGYPAFLSLFIQGKPDSAFEQRVLTAQMLLGIATCAMVLLLALRLLPWPWAVAIGIITAISPHLATINTYLLTESLFTFLMAASLYALVRLATNGVRRRWAVAAGILLGLASLVRPQLQLLPFVIIGLCLIVPRLRPELPKALLASACFVALLLPWQLRNASVERPPGEPDLLAATLYHGSFPGMMYRDDPRSFGMPYRFDPHAAAHSRDVAASIANIRDEFRKHPGQMLDWYLLGKPKFFLSWGLIAGAGDIFVYPVLASPYISSPIFRMLHVVSFWLHWPLTLLAIGASIIAIARPDVLVSKAQQRNAWRLLAVIFTFLILMHMIGAPYPRYGIPFRPLFYLLGIAMARALWLAGVERISSRRMEVTQKVTSTGVE